MQIVEIGEYKIKACQDFKYFGNILISDGEFIADITARITAGYAMMEEQDMMEADASMEYRSLKLSK